MSDQNMPSTENTVTSKGPIKRHYGPDGVFAKVWEQQTDDGKLFYTATVGRTFTDPDTGQARDGSSLTQAQMNALPGLIMQANQTIDLLNQRRPENECGLKAQRDAAFAKKTALQQPDNQAIKPDQNRTPEM
ncbi:MAG: hypothetical protein WBF53_03125 [Litorimonas sp.]